MFDIFRRKKEVLLPKPEPPLPPVIEKPTKHKDIRQQPIVFQPTVYKALKPIVDELIDYKKITIDLSKLSAADRVRTIDFLSGVTYALKGHHQKIADQVFLFAVV